MGNFQLALEAKNLVITLFYLGFGLLKNFCVIIWFVALNYFGTN